MNAVVLPEITPPHFVYKVFQEVGRRTIPPALAIDKSTQTAVYSQGSSAQQCRQTCNNTRIWRNGKSFEVPVTSSDEMRSVILFQILHDLDTPQSIKATLAGQVLKSARFLTCGKL
jgi:hypothetical protein